MKIVEDRGTVRVEGLPEGNIELFLAYIDQFPGYCVIFGPKKCLHEIELGIFGAKVGFGQANQELEIFNVSHGHKYHTGGGFVETDHGQIFFRLLDHEKQSSYEGMLIDRNNIFIVT